MGRRHASAAGLRARGLPTAAGTDTQATPGQQEHQRAEDRTSRSQACGGCRMRSGSPRPKACMAGSGGRVSWRTGTCRNPLCRQPRDQATGRGRARVGSVCRRGTPRTGPNANRSATRWPRTQQGDHSQRILPPPLPATLLPKRQPRSGLSAPPPPPTFFARSGKARQRTPPLTPPPPPPVGHRPWEGRPQRQRSRL